MNVDLNLYIVFISLVENGSMNKAASELNVTASAISQNLKLLEEQVDEKLFNRQRQGLILTKAGRLLYEDIYKPIKTLINSHLRIKNGSITYENKLIIATSSALFREFVLPSLSIFSNYNIVVKSHLSNYDQIKSIEDEIADFAIIKEFSQPKKNNIEINKIGELNFVFFYNPKLLKESEIFSSKIVIKDVGSKTRKNESEQFSKIVKKFRDIDLLGHDHDIIAYVKNHAVVGFAPKEYLNSEFRIIDLGYKKQVDINMLFNDKNVNAKKFLQNFKGKK